MLISLLIVHPTNLSDLTDLRSEFRETSTIAHGISPYTPLELHTYFGASGGGTEGPAHFILIDMSKISRSQHKWVRPTRPKPKHELKRTMDFSLS